MAIVGQKSAAVERKSAQELSERLGPFLTDPLTDREEFCQAIAEIQEAVPGVGAEVLLLIRAMEPEIQQAIATARNENLRGNIRSRLQDVCRCLAPEGRERALKERGVTQYV